MDANRSVLPVAIVDPAASYRDGLSAVLTEARFVLEATDDARAWAQAPGRRVLLWTIRSSGAWKRVQELNELNPELVLVALLVDPTPDAYADALRNGAAGAVAWEAPPETILKVLAAALEGNFLIPLRAGRGLAAKLPAGEDPEKPEWITHEELGWLRILVGGATVHELATSIGYSERALYRMLRALYAKLGVSSRNEAILQASRRRLLD
jgi:DNA-binding NarL/FixJ family response regulator